MKIALTTVEKQATIDAINRFRSTDPALIKHYDLEFVVAKFDMAKMTELKQFLAHSNVKYKQIKEWRTDVIVVVNMMLVPDQILDIESSLTYFANQHQCRYDGWGALE